MDRNRSPCVQGTRTMESFLECLDTDGLLFGGRVFQKSSCKNFPVIIRQNSGDGGSLLAKQGLAIAQRGPQSCRGREGHVDLSPTRLPLATHGSLHPNVRPRPYAAHTPALLVSTDLPIQRPLGHLCVLQAWRR